MWAALSNKCKILCNRLSDYLKRSLQVWLPQSSCRKMRIPVVLETRSGIQCWFQGQTRHLLAQRYLWTGTPKATKCFRIFIATFESLPCFPEGWDSWDCLSSQCLRSFPPVFVIISNAPIYVSKQSCLLLCNALFFPPIRNPEIWKSVIICVKKKSYILIAVFLKKNHTNNTYF